ncbi:NGG1 interacting factor 3-like protein [Flagelloscypha sp. PMI_526]|nr:NGG1 interacting factor 3-like protein [Flagelloscypha sp. PMI_526]
MSGSFLKSVVGAMERIAPLRLAEKWDNVGLLLESPVPKPSKRVLLTIDLTPSVCDEALRKDATVIIAYHPTIFGSLKSFTLANPLQSSLLRCAAAGVSVYSPHTALDCVWGGINDWLGRGILAGSPGSILPFSEEKKSVEGRSEGALGRLVALETPVSIDEVIPRVKECLGIPHVQLARAFNGKQDVPVRTVAICAGSGGSVLGGVDADLYFTGEMQHVCAVRALCRFLVGLTPRSSTRFWPPSLQVDMSY